MVPLLAATNGWLSSSPTIAVRPATGDKFLQQIVPVIVRAPQDILEAVDAL